MNESMHGLMEHKALRTALIAALVILTLFLATLTWNAAFGRKANEPYYTITVSGTGKSATIPDIAKIQYTVTESAATVADAQKTATDKSDAALVALADLGVEDKDVKTVYYNVAPKYEASTCAYGVPCPPRNQKIIGYDVSQSVEVTVRDTGKAGAVLEALGTLGVQNISGPNFTVDDDTDVRAEARAEAIAQAREKAKVLAKELGARLGKVVSFSEDGGAYPYYAYGKGGMEASYDAVISSAPTLPTGQNETSVNVSITYEIR